MRIELKRKLHGNGKVIAVTRYKAIASGRVFNVVASVLGRSNRTTRIQMKKFVSTHIATLAQPFDKRVVITGFKDVEVSYE